MNKEKFEAGLAVRRAVLGEEYVDKSLSSMTEFTKPLQEMVTENCWGEVWTRGVLERKTRSLLTISMMVALKMPHELQLHVLGALRNGCSVEEIQETLLHATVYSGIPAGVEAFKAAKEVIENWRKEQ